MKIMFRVDASLQMGTGHVMRCLTLAQRLMGDGAEVEFICRKHQGNLIEMIRSRGITVFDLEIHAENVTDHSLSHSQWLGSTQEQDARDCINVLNAKRIDWFVVDHYALDKNWHNMIRPYVTKILVIDDLADKNFECDVVLNQNLGSNEKDYIDKTPNNCQLWLGCDYSMLRLEFENLRPEALEKRKNTKEIKKILVSVGGSDNQNLTYDILQDLDDQFDITVVLGLVSPHNEMIQNYAKDKNIRVLINVNNMAELMLEADLAIGAGGASSWERCCLGLPTLLFIVAENQRAVAKILERSGAAKITKCLKDDLQMMAGNLELWRTMSEKAQTICDGLGVKRIKLL